MSGYPKLMRVLAIDPGYDRIGVAVLEKNLTGQEVVLFSTCITTPKTANVAERILIGSLQIKEIIANQKPTHLALESLFFNKNVKTAIGVAEARGAFRLVAQLANLKIVELNPQQIKVAMTGYGKSDKKAIYQMVNMMVLNPPQNALDDEYDAIAIGVTCLAHYNRDSKIP
jgi:crossover junction endodeoxyribonuclease RuvC